ncbi:MAG: ribonuclease E/G [Rhodospirillaceae bacterium]|nr:ribonuclease E/G [Rhodospirillaceae bacterium]
MVKRMLIDATHPEETRVVVLDGTRLEEFDVETSTKKQIKGNIYLAKVVRVEPSLQAAFVDYGGNRHGFLAFSEIHPDYYQIPVADRERLMAEVARHQDEEDEHTSSAPPPPHTEDRDHHDDHGHDEHAPDGHHDDHAHDDHAHDEHGEVPLAFIPPAITAEISPDEPHDEPALAEGGAAPEPHHEDDHHEEDGGPEPQRGVIEEIEPVATAETVTEVGGDTAPAPAEAAPEAAEGTDRPVAEVLPPAPAPDTVGGEDDEDDDAAAVDKQRRRFVAARHYKIQEVIKRRQIMLVQVVKEERGNKGAALTTFLSLAGRYCVLMPNSARGGGVSRKITSAQDRRRLKQIVGDLELPSNMAVILRTAGADRNKAEIKRDYEYLQRTWNQIREVTMGSRAPALIHEEASLIKRAIRDIYSRDIEEIWVDGEEGYKTGKDFMKTLTPSHAKKVQRYKDDIIPLYHRYQVETQMESINSPVVQLRSGGSIVFAQTEALVAIDVNSGRATKERHIEETAYKTNMEAAEEIARQLRLRDLAGLIVIDFIDMEDNRNNHAVERRLKESLKADRARIQVGRISHFGLLELSRQRLRPSLIETNFKVCTHCAGSGMVRSTESAAVHSLRMLEEEGVRRRSSEVTITVHPDVALYMLNYKREMLASIEARYGLKVYVLGDPALIPPNLRLDRIKAHRGDDGEHVVAREHDRESLPAPVAVDDEDEDGAEASNDEQPRERHEGHREGRDRGGRIRRDRGDRDRGERDRGERDHSERDRGERDQNREHRSHDGGPRDDEDGGGRKRRRRRRRRGGGGHGENGRPDENRGFPGQPDQAAREDAGNRAFDDNGPGEQTAGEPVPGEQGQGDQGEGGRDGGRRRRRGRRGGRRRRRGGEGERQGGFDAQDGTPHRDDGSPAAPESFDTPRVSEPASVETRATPAQESPQEPAQESGGGASRFFRAIKSRLRGDSDDAKDEAPAPAPVAATPPPAAAPPVTVAPPPAPPAPEEPAGPKRGGWWQNPTK